MAAPKTKKAATVTRGKRRFAGYPSAQAWIDSTGKKKIAGGGQLPWGFEVWDTGEREGKYSTKDIHGKAQAGKYAVCRRYVGGARKKENVYIREHELQDERLLEVVFVDIGQGDGCFLVTPDEKRMVIDAGEGDNMRHYLNWRHGPRKDTTFEAAIISHPDADHYKGFVKLFTRDNFYFETVYTNGLMERLVPKSGKAGKKKRKAGSPKATSLGPVRKIGRVSLVTELVTSKTELRKFLAVDERWVTKTSDRDGSSKPKKSGKQFPTLLNEALGGWKIRTKKWKEGDPGYTAAKEGSFYDEEFQDVRTKATPKDKKVGTMGDFRMLSVDDEYMPGYEPGPDRDLTIQVLGPVTENVGGRPMLRWLESNVGKTKNGHSVVLRLQYRNVSMMLGGDLNIPSEHLLMSHHTGMESPPDMEHEAAFVDAARRVFQVDIAKSCHHGSSDFTHFFLRALNPIATVVSSGDDEPHSHPRSDTLGAIGSCSRSNPRPLIFSTELARSTKDSNQKPWELRSEILKKVERIVAAKSKGRQEELLEKLEKDLTTDIPRSVAVYGAIHVATDGHKVIIYQKLETRGSHGSYDIYRLEPSGKDGKGPLMYQSKH